MSRVIETQEIDSNDLWEITHAAKQLTAYGCSVSARHLKDLRTRMQFNRELAYYGKRVVEDVMQRRLTLQEGLGEIKKEQQSLIQQAMSAVSRLAGIAGGVGQLITGAGICYRTAGALCPTAGLPMMAHGGNNIYENGRNLYEGRDDVEGPLKKIYQDRATALGYTERDGTNAYLAADLALSGFGLFRKVPKSDSWRLFRYMDTDKERAIRQMGKGGLTIEIWNNSQSIKQILKESEE